VATPFVVEQLDVIKDIGSCIVPGVVDFPLYPLALEQLKEALGHGIVMAVAPATHTTFQAVRIQD
jgi:hypothetical protein